MTFQTLLVLGALARSVLAGMREYPSDKLNIHLFCHTHDDPGWLKTVDQYYYGSNRTDICDGGVKYILDTVLVELQQDPTRLFTYGEMSYFQRWYVDLPESKRQQVKKLVSSGQLTFANGGWVMHDEATTHYISMIDQTTLGHRFLKEEFGYSPRIGWQLDPFGHSGTQATLLSDAAGFDGMFFGRIDYQDFNLRKESKSLELIWKASQSNPNSEIFAECFQYGYYPAPGLCWDCGDDPVMDNTLLEDSNVEHMMQVFRSAIEAEVAVTKGNHVSLRMGGDFMYQNAAIFFSNIDKMIAMVNQDPRYHMFYSTPEIYIDAKNQEGIRHEEKTDDFFPYSDCEHCFWSGYYSSRVTTKRIERLASGHSQVLKQLTTADHAAHPSVPVGKHSMGSGEAVSPSDSDDSIVFHLSAGLGVFNHHDGVSGTAKQHVANDYIKRIDRTLTIAEQRSADIVRRMASREGRAPVPELAMCRQANESVCPVTASMTRPGQRAAVVAYNPLPRATSQHLAVFLSKEAVAIGVAVYARGEAEPVYAEIIPSMPSPSSDAAPYSLHFTAKDVPAFDLSVFEVVLGKFPGSAKLIAGETWSVGNQLIISNENVVVEFDSLTGHMSSVTRMENGVIVASTSVSNDLKYYTSFGSPGHAGYRYPKPDARDHVAQHLNPAQHHLGSESSQNSGAYIFRPTDYDMEGIPVSPSDSLESVVVYRGREVSEVRQVFSSWASTAVRIHKSSPAIDLDYTVGPIPIDDEMGKEVIYTLDSDIQSSSTLYTDSNGREFFKRVKDYRPTWDVEVFEPIAGNYYPVNAAAYLRDEGTRAQLSILTDRSLGAASLKSGEIELMVHRRLLADDSRGVGEPLNETTGGMTPYPNPEREGEGITVSGRNVLLLSAPTVGMREVREQMDKMYLPLSVYYGIYGKGDAVKMDSHIVPVLGQELALNVHIVTLQMWDKSTVLLRLAHQFAVNEDAELSSPVTVDVSELLAPLNPLSMTEMSLTVNQEKEVMLKKKLVWTESGGRGIAQQLRALEEQKGNMRVVLNPMDVRTFLVKI